MRKIKQLKKQEKELLKEKKDRKVVLWTGAIFLSIAIGYFGFYLNKEYEDVISIDFSIGDEIPSDHFCMVTGKIKSNATLSVSIDGNTYRGCCSNCLTKLKTNLNDVIHCRDMYSGKVINKSEAFVGLDPTNKRQVVYFETIENYKNYIQTIKKN